MEQKELDVYVNDFAIRCFRDIADGDYIAARMACRAALSVQFLWSSQQTIEKYLKCALLLNRIEAKRVGHNFKRALDKIENSGKLRLTLTPASMEFISYIDEYGRFRYLEVSHWAGGNAIVPLDRAVWELRRFCTRENLAEQYKLTEGSKAPVVRIKGGYLEKVIDRNTTTSPDARAALLWQNAFFGTRTRKWVRPRGWFHASNSPLSIRPEIFDEVRKYVYLPNEMT